ncbi:MAG: phage late control D family protein [Pseudomonas sp.]|uniref:phage late control D family protein n=1 Tax=Pseudomonas sp. TaxID=306 RepID=UPI003398C543
MSAQTATQPRPAYRLTLDSEDITARIQGRLISLTLTDNRGMEADQLDLVLDDSDGRLSIPRSGVQLALAIGWHGSPLTSKGLFTVDESSHTGAPDQLTIRARSADLREGLRVKKEKSWHQTTLGDLVKSVAQAQGLKPVISDALAAVAVQHLDQTNESDINLLTRLASEHDAIATVKDGKLLFMPAGLGATASGRLIGAATITRADGDQHTYSVTDRDAYTGVKAYWQQDTTGEKREVIEGDGDNLKALRHTYASAASALRAAKAEYARVQRGAATFTLTLARGRPDLYPETPLQVSGWKAEINANPWLITKIIHSISDSGYTSALEAEVSGASQEAEST